MARRKEGWLRFAGGDGAEAEGQEGEEKKGDTDRARCKPLGEGNRIQRRTSLHFDFYRLPAKGRCVVTGDKGR